MAADSSNSQSATPQPIGFKPSDLWAVVGFLAGIGLFSWFDWPLKVWAWIFWPCALASLVAVCLQRPTVRPKDRFFSFIERVRSCLWCNVFILGFLISFSLVRTITKSDQAEISQDTLKIKNLIESEGYWVGAGSTELNSIFAKDACYIAHGSFEDREGKAKAFLSKFPEYKNRYYDIAKRWSAFLGHDNKPGEQAIVQRYRGNESGSNVPVNGDSMVYRHRVTNEGQIEIEGNLAFGKTQTEKRHAGTEKSKFAAEDARSFVSWVFRCADDATRKWELVRMHGGMTEDENDMEYDALKNEMKEGAKTSPKFINCYSLLFKNYVPPPKPTKQEAAELEKWLKRCDYLNRRSEQDSQNSFALLFPKLTYKLNERAKAKPTA